MTISYQDATRKFHLPDTKSQHDRCRPPIHRAELTAEHGKFVTCSATACPCAETPTRSIVKEWELPPCKKTTRRQVAGMMGHVCRSHVPLEEGCKT